MKLDNVELHASPHFTDATCPKGHGSMIELSNGWFSVCWYCEKCKYPYQLVMRKIAKVNKEGLKKALKQHYEIEEERKAKAQKHRL